MRPITGIVGVVLSTGVALGGDTFTWIGGGGNDNWTNQLNWEDSSQNNGVPGAGDQAVIDDADAIVIIQNGDSIIVETIEILDATAMILIEADGTDNGKLTLTNHDCALMPVCGGNSILNGVIELENEATLAFTTRDHTISGTGAILSPVDNSNPTDGGQITIASGIFFKNGKTDAHTTIRGALTISGAGRFINDGTVEAVTDDDQTPDTDFLIVNADIIEDTDDAKWITNCQAQLLFLNSACLEGDFFDMGVSGGPGGEFSFTNATVHTRGVLSLNGCGTVFISLGSEFAVADVIDDFGCEVTTTLLTSTCDGFGDIGKVPPFGGETLCAANP